MPVPGPCAAVAALSVAGVAATEFVFAGFLPRGNKPRRGKVAEVAAEHRAVVLYEAPHRLLDTLGDLAAAGMPERQIVCARELTKLHEELHRGTVSSARRWYQEVVERDGRLRGEFTLVLAPLDDATIQARRGEALQVAEDAAAAEVRLRLGAGGAISRIAKDVAAEFGVPRSKVYEEALRQKKALQEDRRKRNSRGNEEA